MPKKRYIVRYNPDLSVKDKVAALKQHLIKNGATEGVESVEELDDADEHLFYVSLSEKDFKTLEEKFSDSKRHSRIRAVDEDTDYEKKKKAPAFFHIVILFSLCLGLFTLEQLGILPSALLLSGQLIYIGIALLTFIALFYATKHCLTEMAAGKNIGLNILILVVVFSGWLFSLAVLIAPAFFLPLGLAPLFSLPLATITALAMGYYYDASEEDKMRKQWCNIANTKIAQASFQRFQKISGSTKTTISFEEIKAGDMIEVKHNISIPVNGIILKNPDQKEKDHKGYSIDEAVITGESEPKVKGIGDPLRGSSINKSNESLYLEAKENGSDVLKNRIANFNRFGESQEKTYNLCLISSIEKDKETKQEHALEKGKLYVEKKDNSLIYRVINFSGKERTGEIDKQTLQAMGIENFETLTDKTLLKALESYLSKILALLYKRGDLQKEKFSESHAVFLFTILVIIGVSATALLWFFLGPAPVLSYMLLQGLSVLTCSSPCMVAIAQLLPIYVARSFFFKNGLFIRDNTIKKMRKVTMVIFDKTGTLTGELQVCEESKSLKQGEAKSDEILKLVASLENEHASNSDFALSFCTYARKRGIQDYYPVEKDEEKAGTKRKAPGVQGKVKTGQGTKHVAFGSYAFIKDIVSNPTQIETDPSSIRARSFIAIDGQYWGWVEFQSDVRSDAPPAIAKLKRLGIKVVMLTGDSNKKAAEEVAKAVGIEGEAIKGIDGTGNIYFDVKSHEKQNLLEKKNREGEITAMVGDGLNDEGALREAMVSLAIGERTPAAEYTDGSLRGQIEDIPKLFEASRKVHTQIEINLWSLLTTTMLAMWIAAGISYPILGFLLAPTIASIIGGVIGLISVGIIFYNYHSLNTYLKACFVATASTLKRSDSLSPTPVISAAPSTELRPLEASFTSVRSSTEIQLQTALDR